MINQGKSRLGRSARVALLLPITSAFFLCFSDGLPPSVAEGRMTGGGNLFNADGDKVTHGFELHCNIVRAPGNLQINWAHGTAFHLETITSSGCFNNELFSSSPRQAPFDTIWGRGTGRLNDGRRASAEWTFTDRGEPGREDTARIFIWDDEGNLILSVDPDLQLNGGNHQAHPENKKF